MKTRQRRFYSALSLGMLLTAALTGAGCGGGNGTTAAPPITDSALSRAVVASRTQAKIPAMYAAVIDTNSIVVTADGVHKQGGNEPAQKEDRVHLGSNTKAMTSTLIGMYVEAGKMRWDMKLSEVFPEFAATMRPEFQEVTLAMLLELRAGLLAVFDKQAFLALPTFSGTPAEQRKAYTQWVLQQPPDATPGTYNYSNSDYVVAAAVLEKVTGKTWDDLLQERLLRPLGITTLTYGWPAANGAKQPWGHLSNADGTFMPLDPDIAENKLPKYFAPAGDLSMSMGDYAKFVQMHLRGLRGQQTLLRAETIQRMHTPPANSDYALGWAVETRNGVKTSFYVGSLEPFLADVWVQPSRNRAVAVVTNTGTDTLPTQEALIGQLIGDNATPTKAATLPGKTTRFRGR